MCKISADILVYGGSFAGCSAALKAAQNASSKKVVLICPDRKLGSIGTVGGQNYMDLRSWKGVLPQKGSLDIWRQGAGHYYNVDIMSDVLQNTLAACPNLTVYYQCDIKNIKFKKTHHKKFIKELTIANIYRDASGYIRWDHNCEEHQVIAKVFIDASDEGRLVRLAEPSHTVGRYDWPNEQLDCDELVNKDLGRQQAATLMMKMTGIKNTGEKDMSFTKDSNGSVCCWGGNVTYRTNSIVMDFNNKYGPTGYSLKPVNAAQNGANSSQWWINAFLVYNVDGRAVERDKNTWRYPKNIRSDYRNSDNAWVDAREFLKTKGNEFLTAIRQYPGFAEVDFVYADDGYPVVAEVMYLRETIHMASNYDKIGNDTENTNYALITDACRNAGATYESGSDAVYYKTRMGLSFYWTDINAYKFEDLKNKAGEYIASIVQNIRQDLQVTKDTTSNPVFIPISALISPSISNLLACGYAMSIPALGWAETRVIPNLCVTGDAAGVVAAYAVNNNILPSNYSDDDITNIQKILVDDANVKIDKY